MKVSSITAKAAQIGASAMVLAGTALAAPTKLEEGISDAKPTGAGTDLGNIFVKVADVLIYLVGALAVIMLIIGGLRYVLSQGNKDSVQGAKDTILYAIIGIVVSVLAFAAVRFVQGQF